MKGSDEGEFFWIVGSTGERKDLSHTHLALFFLLGWRDRMNEKYLFAIVGWESTGTKRNVLVYGVENIPFNQKGGEISEFWTQHTPPLELTFLIAMT